MTQRELTHLLNEYYQTLRHDSETAYNPNGIRAKIASEAEKLCRVLDELDRTDPTTFDANIFSFLQFVCGYDTPDFESDTYLFSKEDLDREFNLLK